MRIISILEHYLKVKHLIALGFVVVKNRTMRDFGMALEDFHILIT